MQPTLQPIAELPLVGSASQGVYTAELTFAPDQPVLYIRQPVTTISRSGLIRWHAPDVAAPLLFLTLVTLALLVRRTVHRPREPGRIYCRHCNHELAAPAAAPDARGRPAWLTPDARCTECGRGGPRPPLRGSRRRIRLIPVLTTGLFPLMALSAALLWGLSPATGPTWPVAGLDRFGWHIRRAEPHRPLVHRIASYRLPSGRRVRSFGDFPVRGMRNGLLSPDGKTLALALWPGAGEGAIVLLDTATGTARRTAAPANPSFEPDLVAFSPDSAHLYVQWHRHNVVSYETSLERLDVRTLASDTVASIPGQFTGTPPMQRTPFGRFHVGGPGDLAKWVLVRIDSVPQPPSSSVDLFWSDGQTQHSRTLTLPAGPFWEPSLLPGGQEISLSVGTFGAIRQIDLETGQVTPRPPAAVRTINTPAHPRLELRASPTDPVVHDARSGAAVATLATRGWNMATATISPDGRFVAVQAIRPPPAAIGAATAQADSAVWVWDLGQPR